MLCGPCHSSFTVDINIACQNPWTCMPFDWAPLGNHQNNQKVILGCYCILFIWLCGFWCRWKCNFKKNREVGAFSSLKLTRVSKTSVPFVKELWCLCYVKHQQSKCPTIPMLVTLVRVRLHHFFFTQSLHLHSLNCSRRCFVSCPSCTPLLRATSCSRAIGTSVKCRSLAVMSLGSSQKPRKGTAPHQINTL